MVNTYNSGTLPFLPDDAVIEVQAAVGRRGATPLPVAPVDPLYAGLIANVTAYEDLALEAALRGGRDRVFRALLAHPLVGQYDLAESLTDRLIAHNREHLAWAVTPAGQGRPRRRRGQQQDRRRVVAADGTVLATARAGGLPAARRSASGTAVDTVADAVGRAFAAAGRRLRDQSRPVWPTPTCPWRSEQLAAALHARGVGRRPWRSATTPSRSCGPAWRSRAGSPWCAARASTAWACCPTAGSPASPPWAGSPATGAAGAAWPRRPCGTAARAEDGRGGPTALARTLPAHFGLDSMYALIEALHLGHIEHARRHELMPVLFATAADGDPVARALVDRLADEVAPWSVVALTRLDLLDEETPVLLGGGVLAARHPQLDDRIRELLAERAPKAVPSVVTARPVLGSALLGLDHEGAPALAHARVREFYERV